jgi:hypothetical protein
MADKYGLPILGDHALDRLVQHVRSNLVKRLSTNRDTYYWIAWLRRVWGSGQDCFEDIKTAAVEGFAKVMDSVIEREDLQNLLSDRKDFDVALIKELGKRANSTRG